MGRTVIACAAIVLVAGVLAGCRQEEQGRPIIPHKGTYLGPADAKLSKAQTEKLTDRAALQGDISTGGPAAGGPATAETPAREAPARVPESATPNLDKALSDRVRMQSGN